ncbi:hypothetical protein [Fuchsiella alkaliacetigena]|uniref:hypothetical protein n=1 Tax=Fuchsiella alkaliacetigena TaxID=957042 RepID=UPI00200B37BD|nr:hypothetical protein [Fuchsiella alkaliacetigena]MCK8826028.1 hypothetical protein [Fuchsiella alkaliacetigena]
MSAELIGSFQSFVDSIKEIHVGLEGYLSDCQVCAEIEKAELLLAESAGDFEGNFADQHYLGLTEKELLLLRELALHIKKGNWFRIKCLASDEDLRGIIEKVFNLSDSLVKNKALKVLDDLLE